MYRSRVGISVLGNSMKFWLMLLQESLNLARISKVGIKTDKYGVRISPVVNTKKVK
jgi:hypothetical protein